MLNPVSLRSPKKVAEQVRDAVADFIRDQGLKAGDRIPTEAELCAAFGISRPSVREALRLLEQERLIVTEHGRGRFVTATALLKVARPITAFESITTMLAALGFHPVTRVISARIEPGSDQPAASAALGLGEGATVFVLERIREDGDQVLVYSIDILPADLIPDATAAQELTGSVNELLAAHGHRPVMSTANVAAANLPDGAHQSVRGVAVEEPWLLVTETCLAGSGRPVLYARDYHRGNAISFNFSRQ